MAPRASEPIPGPEFDPNPLAAKGYIVGWGNNYYYPGTQTTLDFNRATVLQYNLGDVTKVDTNDGPKFIATLSYTGSLSGFTMSAESSEGIFNPSGLYNEIDGFEEVAELEGISRGLTLPTLYHGGNDLCSRPWFFIGFSNVPPADSPWGAGWDNAVVQVGKMYQSDFCGVKPPPVRPPIFRGVVTFNYSDYIDADGDGVIDAEILASLNLIESVGFERLHVIGLQEDGYDFLALAVSCYYKNKNKVVCSSEETDIPGLLVDMENRMLYLQEGFFEEGDEVDLKIILRAYDKNKDDKEKIKKPKKCKKDDKCIDVKIKIVS